MDRATPAALLTKGRYMKTLLTLIALTFVTANASAADFDCYCRLDEESVGVLSEQNNTTADKALEAQKKICGDALVSGNGSLFNFDNEAEARAHGAEIARCVELK